MGRINPSFLLPNSKSYSRNLACQRKPGHGRLLTLSDLDIVEVPERTRAITRTHRGVLEDFLEVIVMVCVQAADERRFLRALQLSVNVSIVGAARCPDG